ncbi:syndetin [Daktulosphaira vitifoliae]|uniref:syndetin n=1 Tax=Daktulosphaira vitifoliae TaxID=58002 RepID=UPI0021A9B151|nr:syndetin [Daktulosphaira vitifoliae]XP_050526009.1 syndetin [Daktulosphaira vitifoliae]
MAEFTQKLKNFLETKSTVKVPIIGSQDFWDNSNKNTSISSLKILDDVPDKCDADIIANIDQVYFNNDDFDYARFELEKLPEVIDKKLTSYDIKKLKAQHEIVEKQLLQLILENQAACDEELDKIEKMQNNLKSSLENCEHAKNCLKLAKRQITTASLGLLGNCQKKSVIIDLLNTLNSIKILFQAEKKLEDLVSKANYAQGITLILECIQGASTYKQFTCIAALSIKLQDALIMTEEQLDIVLSNMCFNFDHEKYSAIQEAYKRLGKTRIAIDQLHMHYISAVYSASFDTINLYVDVEQVENSKNTFVQLCQCIPDEQLIPCLVALSKIFWNILQSYKKASDWHKDLRDVHCLNEDDIEEYVNQEYINKKFEVGPVRLWGEIITKVSNLVFNSNITQFKFDDFLQVLSILNKHIQIGEDFCSSKSEQLQNDTKKLCTVYFQTYHKKSLDELTLFFENESWTLCPVKQDFNLLQLKEFKSIKNRVQNIGNLSHNRNSSQDSSLISSYDLFLRPDKSPFDDDLNTTYSEDILDTEMDVNSVCSDDSNNSYEEVDNCSIPTGNKKQSPLLTNTTLTVMRHCGKYLKMCYLLKSISENVVTCLCQLFEYYLYSIHLLFTSDVIPTIFRNESSIKLQSVITRIRNTLVQCNLENENDEYSYVREPDALHMLSLEDANNMYGVSERIVAVESLVFLAEQFNLLHDYLHSLIVTDSGVYSLQQFYNQTVSVSMDLRKPIYGRVICKAIDFNQVLNMMVKVNWELKDIMCEHSRYVDYFLQEIRAFFKSFKTSTSNIFINEHILNSFWESIGVLVSFVFIEGFSLPKKCSNAGRALMQLDYTQFMSQIKLICPISPMPYSNLIEVYIKAYYLPETSLESWTRDHQEYSHKQLLSIINCVCQNNKRLRQKLTALLEEFVQR